MRIAPWRIMNPPDPSCPMSAAMAVSPKYTPTQDGSACSSRMISGASTAGSTLPTEPQVCCRNIAPTAISIRVKWRNSFRWTRSNPRGARRQCLQQVLSSVSATLGSEAEQANHLTRGSQSPRIVLSVVIPALSPSPLCRHPRSIVIPANAGISGSNRVAAFAVMTTRGWG